MRQIEQCALANEQEILRKHGARKTAEWACTTKDGAPCSKFKQKGVFLLKLRTSNGADFGRKRDFPPQITH